MKKLLALLLALCALFTFAMAETETAEEAETAEAIDSFGDITWERWSRMTDTSLGQFIPIGSLPYVFWSPDPFDWETVEESGALECYEAMGETADGTPYTVTVALLDPGTFTEAFMDSHAQSTDDWSDYEKGTINGMPAVTFYTVSGDETEACFVIWPDESAVVTMTVKPFGAEDLNMLFATMCASVQPAQ